MKQRNNFTGGYNLDEKIYFIMLKGAKELWCLQDIIKENKIKKPEYWDNETFEIVMAKLQGHGDYKVGYKITKKGENNERKSV